jgi:HAMP domain-containing protein
MLRRKILARVGLLAFAFVLGSVAAVWLLQDVLGELDRSNKDAAVLIDGVQSLGTAVVGVETAWREGAGPETVGARIGELRGAMELIRAHPSDVWSGGDAPAAYAKLTGLLPAYLDRGVASGGGAGSAGGAGGAGGAAVEVEFLSAVQELGRALREYVAAEQVSTFRHFRTMVLVLTLAALVMLNTTIFVLLNLAQMVLKPVSSLVEGARELSAERFEHRVVVEDQDEFGELARSYNRLAEQLQANEARKTETLQQLAVTLNHGLNNAMSIIELQLGMLDRQSGGNPTLAKHLREIRGCLNRMAEIVSSLKNIRRVVLTDYAPGLKMIDLERSVGEADPGPGVHGAPSA